MGGFSQNGHHHHHHHQVANHQVVPQPSVHNHVASSQGIIHQQQQPPPSPTGNVGHVTHQQAPPPQQPTTMNHGPSVEVSFPLSREKACRFREIAESDHKLIRDLQKFGIHSIRFQGSISVRKNVRYLKLVIVQVFQRRASHRPILRSFRVVLVSGLSRPCLPGRIKMCDQWVRIRLLQM